MNLYQISVISTGVILGHYLGENEDEAINAMHDDARATPEQRNADDLRAELTTITCTVTQLEAAWGHGRTEWGFSGGDPEDDDEELRFAPTERYDQTGWQLYRWIEGSWEGMAERYTAEEIKELIDAL